MSRDVPEIPGLTVTPPTKAVPFPLVLVEGEEHSGKSWAVAEFTRSERIGPVWWLPLNEGGTADHYGRIPGTNYGVVRLQTGDYHEIVDVVTKIRAKAQEILDAGQPPAVLVIDSVSGIWEGLKDWVSERARASRTGQRILADDPHAEVKPARNLWNDANLRWHRLQGLLKTFPGIVIITARGKEVGATDPATGQPAIDERTRQPIKSWSTEVNRDLPYAVDVWVRMRRESAPAVVDVRSVEHGKKPGEDKEPEPIKDRAAEGRLLEWLIFDALGLDLATAYVGDFKAFAAGALSDGELANLERELRPGNAAVATPRGARPTAKALYKRIGETRDDDELRAVWVEANRNAMLQVDVETPSGPYSLGDLITARHEHFVELAKRANGANPAVQRDGARNASAEAVAAAWESTGTDRSPDGAPDPSVPAAAEPEAQEPDPPEACKMGAPRRGVLAALEQLIGGEEAMLAAVGERYGRGVEQVATAKLRTWVGELTAAQREKGAA